MKSNTWKSMSIGRHICSVAILVGLALTQLQSSLLAQCATAVLQTETGSVSRSKVGAPCLSGDPCPTSPEHYYLTDKTIESWNETSGGCGPNCFIVTTYYSSKVVQYSLPSNDPVNDYCGSAGPTTTTFSGQYSYYTTGDCYPGFQWDTTITYDPTRGGWYDQNTNLCCDPWVAWYGDCGNNSGLGNAYGWYLINLSCDSWIKTNDAGGSFQETLTSEYTTAALESLVDGLAPSRAPSTFSTGCPTMANSIDSEEFCATAVRTTNWRIMVTGAIPNKSYDISWIKVVQHADGTSQRTPMKITRKAPNQDPWYITGDAISKPIWPSGCPANGGTESITYVGPDSRNPSQITIVLSPNQ